MCVLKFLSLSLILNFLIILFGFFKLILILIINLLFVGSEILEFVRYTLSLASSKVYSFCFGLQTMSTDHLDNENFTDFEKVFSNRKFDAFKMMLLYVTNLCDTLTLSLSLYSDSPVHYVWSCSI